MKKSKLRDIVTLKNFEIAVLVDALNMARTFIRSEHISTVENRMTSSDVLKCMDNILKGYDFEEDYDV